MINKYYLYFIINAILTQSWSGLEHPACTLCWNGDACAGLVSCENGRWQDPKRSLLRRTNAGKAPHRQTTAALQRCLQKGSEGLGNWPQRMKKLGLWSLGLEAGCAPRPFPVWGDTCPTDWGKEGKREGPKSRKQTSDRHHLLPMWERLPLSNRPLQPQQTLFQSHHSGCETIVFRDWGGANQF